MRRAKSLFTLSLLAAGCGARTGLSEAPGPDAGALDVEVMSPSDDGPASEVFTPQPNVTCESATPLPPGVDVDLVVDTAGGRDRVSACEVPVIRGGPVRYYRLTVRPMEQVAITSDYLIPLPYARLYADCRRSMCLAQTRVGGVGAFLTWANPGAQTEVIVALGFDYGTVAEVPSGTLRMRVSYAPAADPAACRPFTPLRFGVQTVVPTQPLAAASGCRSWTYPLGARFAIGRVQVPPGRTVVAQALDAPGPISLDVMLACSTVCPAFNIGTVQWRNDSTATVPVDIAARDLTSLQATAIQLQATLR